MPNQRMFSQGFQALKKYPQHHQAFQMIFARTILFQQPAMTKHNSYHLPALPAENTHKELNA
jgi:hypothetical protein